MTNFATRWRTPQQKAPPRKYLNSAGSPLVLCGLHDRGKWLLTFADETSRVTAIRPTPEMVAIHNATLTKAARKCTADKAMHLPEPPTNWG